MEGKLIILNKIPFDLVVLHLEIHPKCTSPKQHKIVFTVAFGHYHKKGNNPVFMRRLNKQWYFYAINYYTTIKKNKDSL